MNKPLSHTEPKASSSGLPEAPVAGVSHHLFLDSRITLKTSSTIISLQIILSKGKKTVHLFFKQLRDDLTLRDGSMNDINRFIELGQVRQWL